MARSRKIRVSQAWIEILADDPEALSAAGVARDRLEAARPLTGVRRLRVFELCGDLPGPEEIEGLLHRSIQFYNPHKERCTMRAVADDPAPLADGERVVLVTERGGERRVAAERWWFHVTGKTIEVWEGIAWALSFTSEGEADRRIEDLARLRERRHGLLCNPHAQESRIAPKGAIPLPWIKRPARPRRKEGEA
jgi:hypothetical protein